MEQTFIQDCLAHRLFPDRPLPAPLDLDWDRVYDLLLQHRLAGLFYVLGRDRPDLWPPAFQERLQAVRYRALLRGGRCMEQVTTVLTALRRADVPAIVLKGWAVIPTIYENDPSLRTYEDIDLLVRPQDAARAENLLHDLGYASQSAEPWPGYLRRYHNSRAYQLPDQPTYFGVGLHWGLLDTPFYDRRMPAEGFFARARPIQVAGVDALSLAPEDHVVYTCGHLALHHEYDEALFRYYELAAPARSVRAGLAFDWDAVATRAAAWRLIVPVQRVLAHVEALWPGTVPAPALARIAALRPTRAERAVHRWVVEKRANPAVRAAVAWLTLPGLGRRLRFLLETACPSPAYMRQRYGPAPGGRWPLLYLRRAAMAARHALSRS